MSFIIRSSAFKDGGDIPTLYTGDGEDVSPALSWFNAPNTTKEYALVCEDPDAPGGVFVHWVLYKIPSNTSSLRERMPDFKVLPGDGSRQGVNDKGTIGYTGPKPPPGKPHRYIFKIYALSGPLELEAGASKAQLEKAMTGRVIGEAQWMGRYQRST